MNVIKAWQELLGSENVLIDSAKISSAQTATFFTKQKIIAIVRPGNLKEVQESVRIANQYLTPIYPISCGKNWGLGSKVPVQSESAILDLSRLNKILDYDERLAYITVEPGVTFRQVHQFLFEQKSNLFVSSIGGSADASLIGNTTERGDGSAPAPYGQRLDHVCGLEVVLPTGECIHTGFGRFANAKTTNVNRWGVGPYLDGIFTQSNLGIVTKMTMWLVPLPKYFQTFNCIVKDTSLLEKLLQEIQVLVMQGTLKGNDFALWNSYKVLAGKARYPWKVMSGKTPLSLKELKGLEPWFGNGKFHASSKEQILAHKKVVQQTLNGLVEELNFDEIENNNHSMEEEFSTIAISQNAKSVYWRKKTNIPTDINPDRDNCGVIWLCPALPFLSEQIVEALQDIESIIKSYQFEPNIAFNCISGRSIHMFVAIIYDREILGEDNRAMECHNKILNYLNQKGYIPYRLGIQSMNGLPPAQDDYGHLISTLKQGLDPNDILSPGRYDFRNEWSGEIRNQLDSLIYQ